MRHRPFAGWPGAARFVWPVVLLCFSCGPARDHAEDAAARARLAAADRLTASIEKAMERGRYRDAIARAERQLQVRRALLGNRHPEVAASLMALGAARWRQGLYPEGETDLREARGILIEQVGAPSVELAECLNLLGLLRMAQGAHTEAESLYRAALAMARRASGENPDLVVSCLNNLGAVCQEQRDLVRSEPFRRRALALARELYGAEHPVTARLTFNLGKLMTRIDFTEAEVLYREALEVRRRLLGPRHPDVALTMTLLGESLYEQDRFEEAERTLEDAARIHARALGRDHPYVAWTHLLLGSALLHRGDPGAAIRVFEDVLRQRRRILGPRHPDVRRTLRLAASAYLLRGDYDRAEGYYRDALASPSESVREGEPDYWERFELGRLAMIRGDLESAERWLVEAAAAYERYRRSTTTIERRAAYSQNPTVYTHLAAVRLLRGRHEEAWSAAERSFGRGLLDQLTTPGEEPGIEPRDAHRESPTAAVIEPERRLASLADETGDGAARESVITRLLEAEGALAKSRARRYRASPPGNGARPTPLRSQLGERTALVGWLDIELPTGRRYSWGFVVRRGAPARWVALVWPDVPGTSRLDPQEYRRALGVAASWPYRVTSVDKPKGMARRLFDERLAPILPHLEGIENLVVIPSGAMLGLPVESLVDPGGQTVDERFTVSYAFSATTHAWLRSRARPGGRPRDALVVGDPLGARDESSLLPSSRREVERVAALLPRARVISGDAATEPGLVALRESLRRFHVIHLATHARIDARRPERSHLALSRGDLPDPVEAALSGRRVFDGLLSAQEIVSEWSLDADLVTLSACQTGLGKEAHGEGIVGFAHAFFRAGARSVVVSLWKVDDDATALLMERFYRNLTGSYAGERPERQGTPIPKAAALGEARRWLRDQVDESGATPFRHPCYWSAFVLLGDPG